MRDTRSDEDLMELVQKGDESAFAALFTRHKSPIYGYVLRMVRRPEIADEVFQDTFLSVHRARMTWSRLGGSFRAWLYRIATNAVRDRARRAARRPEILSDDWELSHREWPADRIAIERALAELPENLRDAFVLGAVQGLDHQELAVALSITPDNARARLSRARQRLRELLGDG